jgi:RimJ/RimL family protein N-acetyltransferase
MPEAGSVSRLSDKFPRDLRTGRLWLRGSRRADASSFFDLVHAERERLVESFAEMARISSTSDADRYLVKVEKDSRRNIEFCYGMWHISMDRLIGQIKVKNIDWRIPSAELSYFIAGAWCKQGLTAEGTAAILDAAFSRLSFARVFVRIAATNSASISLAKRLGFLYEGTQRNGFRDGSGMLRDADVLSMTDADFAGIHRISWAE